MRKSASPRMKTLQKIIGAECKEIRIRAEIKPKQIADCCEVTKEDIYSFESGRSCNYAILLYYVAIGLDIQDLAEGYVNG